MANKIGILNTTARLVIIQVRVGKKGNRPLIKRFRFIPAETYPVDAADMKSLKQVKLFNSLVKLDQLVVKTTVEEAETTPEVESVESTGDSTE